MVRIIGFHIPESCERYHHFLQKKFDLKDKTKHGSYQPLTYQPRLYTRGSSEVRVTLIGCDIAHGILYLLYCFAISVRLKLEAV